jgi:membrane-associated phospholipid phosphatase
MILMSTKTITAAYVQEHPLRKNEFTGSRTPGLLARWPMIGLSMFIFGSLLFSAMTYNLYAHGPLLAWDRLIANTLPAIGLKSPPFVKTIMDAGFYIGDQVVMILDILLCIYFIFKRYWQELATVAIGAAGSSAIFLLISNFVARQRPPTQIWIVLTIPGFPSGHAIGVVVFYGLMAYWLAPKIKSAFLKGLVIAIALLIMGFVGFSRIFTGGHYLTDVLAGYAIGIAYFGAIYTLIEIYFQKRRDRRAKEA